MHCPLLANRKARWSIQNPQELLLNHCRNFADIRIVVGQGILDVPEEEEMVFEIERVELHPGFE